MTNYPLRDDATDEQRLHLEIVLDPKTAAGLLTHATELLARANRAALQLEPNTEIARWLQDLEDFRDAR